MLRAYLKKLKNFTLTGKEKAAIGFVSSAIGSYMVQNGLTVHDLNSWSAVKALIVGVIVHQFIYWTTNSK